MATLLVFHGFNSAGGTDKAAFLRNHLTGVEVLSPTYSHDPDRAVADLQNRIEEHTSRYRSVALLGTSLGAYYARYLGRRHGLPTILINPSLDPISTLRPAVGRNRNFKTGECYWFSESHLAALGRYSCDERHADPPTLVLLDMADELLNPADTARRFQNRSNVRVVCFEGGNHRFAHIGEALPYIAEHIGVASHQYVAVHSSYAEPLRDWSTEARAEHAGDERNHEMECTKAKPNGAR